MKIWLGLLSVLLSFSASASESYYKKPIDVPSGQTSDQTSTSMAWGGDEALEAARAIAYNSDSSLPNRTGNRYIYKDRDGQVLLTNINPSGNFDKFTKKVNVDYKKEQEWKRQLDKKPAPRIGMSQKQILNNTNWGKPKNISTTIDASGTSERWMYIVKPF